MDEQELASRVTRRLLDAEASIRSGAPDAPLYRQQRDFVMDTHQFSLFCGGVGSGKTWAGALKALRFALARPCTGIVTAPTFSVLTDATVPTFEALAGSHIKKITTSAPIRAVMSNGSRVLFRSAHKPELLRGPSVSWWWGDEAALLEAKVFKIMLARLRQGGKLGYAWLTTTPKGRNWVYTEFVSQDRQKYAVFRARTADNTYLDPEYALSLAESYSGDFSRQELDGEFISHEGLIFAAFDRSLHVQTQRPDTFSYVVAGVDWGFANPGVIVVYGVDYDGRLWGLHEEHARRRRVEEWVNVAVQLQARYQVETFYCDPASPDFISQFQMAGVHAEPAENEVLTGIQAVQNRLVRQGDGLPRLILSPDFVQTAAEMEQYQWLENRDGLRDQPKKANDHCLDATRYAVMGCETRMTVDSIGSINYAPETGFSSSKY